MTLNRCKGFTLVEVLVALAIVTVALAAGFRSVAQSADSATALKARTLALWVAQNRLSFAQLARSRSLRDTESAALVSQRNARADLISRPQPCSPFSRDSLDILVNRWRHDQDAGHLAPQRRFHRA